MATKEASPGDHSGNKYFEAHPCVEATATALRGFPDTDSSTVKGKGTTTGRVRKLFYSTRSGLKHIVLSYSAVSKVAPSNIYPLAQEIRHHACLLVELELGSTRA